MKPSVLIFSILFFSSCNNSIEHLDGGYDYPKNVSDKDSSNYTLAIKNFESEESAFYHSYDYLFYRLFNEPNLSLQPMPNETFRLVYQHALGKTVIVTFNKDSLTIKEGSPSILYRMDTTRLTALELSHYRLLARRFPLDDTTKNKMFRKYLDSMTKLYPQLLDAAYYHTLYDKIWVRNNEKFDYKFSKMVLQKGQFDSIVNEINMSGYWQLPLSIENDCDIADGASFSLEANTKYKYQLVSSPDCPGDTTKFTKACQHIIELAKLDHQIGLIWDGAVDTPHIVIQDVQLQDVKQPK